VVRAPVGRYIFQLRGLCHEVLHILSLRPVPKGGLPSTHPVNPTAVVVLTNPGSLGEVKALCGVIWLLMVLIIPPFYQEHSVKCKRGLN
jgi:hypothetical protein